MVTGRPDPWESSGEDDNDITSLLGHVGIVVESLGEEDDPLHLVRFPDVNHERTGQRNIESSKLMCVATPAVPITNHLFES
jgi:hypothetical protein